MATPTLPASEASAYWSVASGRQETISPFCTVVILGCIGISNRQRGLKPDSTSVTEGEL